MDMLGVVGIAAVAIFIVLFVFVVKPKGSRKYPYESAGPLLTAAEHVFYASLERAIPDGYVISLKVRMGDVLKVRDRVEKKKAFALRGKVQQKHFDFVICKKKDMTVACCIELNDSSHNRRDRITRDVFVREACAAAGVVLLEVKNRKSYVVDEIRSLVVSAIQGKAAEIETASGSGLDYANQKEAEPEDAKLSTSKLAKKHSCTTDEFLKKLADSMYIQKVGDEFRLTEFGRKIGGEERSHKKFGKFMVWPEDLPLSDVSDVSSQPGVDFMSFKKA